ncbi:WD domain, G-beta repeat [Botrimarina colliarenosi]|uniref:WD domain, G-beta repeat n=2 Tax=Botrimarina colliarenosi TaxID=2528001 RepID=A0A5C6A7M5_9BACT|nr:WD domain, G-beta repeat [Botrimarina colliarenosi]
MLALVLCTLALVLCAGATLASSPAERLVLRMRGAEADDNRPTVVTAVAISGDGQRIAAGGDDHHVRIWNAADGVALNNLTAHGDWVRGARFAADGRRLATVSADHTVCLWSLGVGSPELVVRRLAGGALQAVAWRPDGQAVATAGFGDSLRVFDLDAADDAAPEEQGCACEDTRAVAFSPDGRWVAAAGRNGVVRMWDQVASGGPRDLPSDGRRVRALAFSPDGETLAAGGDSPAVRLWRRDRDGFGGVPDELLVRPGKVHSLAFLDERVLAVGDTQNEITLWDAETRAERTVLRGHTGTVAALAVSDDGRRLVSGSFDTTVRVWDLDPANLPVATTAAKTAPKTR